MRAKILGILLVLVMALLPSSWARGDGEKAFITSAFLWMESQGYDLQI